MDQVHCSCELKEQMIAQIQSMRKECPKEENRWVEWMFPQSLEGGSACCLLTCLFYYGYCKECTASVSEEARMVLSPLMGQDALN